MVDKKQTTSEELSSMLSFLEGKLVKVFVPHADPSTNKFEVCWKVSPCEQVFDRPHVSLNFTSGETMAFSPDAIGEKDWAVQWEGVKVEVVLDDWTLKTLETRMDQLKNEITKVRNNPDRRAEPTWNGFMLDELKAIHELTRMIFDET